MLPSYSTRDPKGWCGYPKRGAAMGRPSKHADDAEAPIKLVLRLIRLDSGGYDANGTYWGGGIIYWYADGDGKVDATLNARNRTDAKEKVRELYPNARFYR